MKLKYLFVIVIFILLIGIVSSLFSLNFDSKLSKIQTNSICQKELLMKVTNPICNEKTPSELDVDFDMDNENKVIKINFEGIIRSSKIK